MDYTQQGISALKSFFNQLVDDGMQLSFTDFIAKVNDLSPSFIKNFGDQCNLYSNGFHWSSIENLMISVAKSFKGNMPTRLGLHDIMDALIKDVSIDSSDFSQLAEITLKSSSDTVNDIVDTGSKLAENSLSVIKYLPYIGLVIVIGVIIWKVRK